MNTLPIYITNANIVLAEDVLTNASLLIENGLISAINPENIPDQVQTVDAQGKTVMPGMIDLHCDALEKRSNLAQMFTFQ